MKGFQAEGRKRCKDSLLSGAENERISAREEQNARTQLLSRCSKGGIMYRICLNIYNFYYRVQAPKLDSLDSLDRETHHIINVIRGRSFWH